MWRQAGRVNIPYDLKWGIQQVGKGIHLKGIPVQNALSTGTRRAFRAGTQKKLRLHHSDKKN